MKHVAALVFALLSLEPAHSAQRFRSGVDAVNVNVVVMNGNRPVAGLTTEHFEVRDSGVPQKLTSIAVDEVPVSMMLALDTSASVEGQTLAGLKEAALAALSALAPNDRAALLTFSHQVALRAGWGQPAASIRNVVDTVQAGGATSLYDAALAALTFRDTVAGNRHLIVLFSDGADTASWLPSRAAIERARRSDAVVYAVSRDLPPREVSLENRSGIELWPRQGRAAYESTPFIQELSELTGGDAFAAPNAGSLRGVFTRIVTDFRSRYILTYTPEGVDQPGWHPIEVTLKGAQGRVRARRGYIR